MEATNSFIPVAHLDSVEEMQEAVDYFINKVHPNKARLCSITVDSPVGTVAQIAGFLVDENDKGLTLFMPMIVGLSMDTNGEKAVMLTSFGFSPLVTIYNSMLRTRSNLVYEIKAAYCSFAASNIDDVLGVIDPDDRLSLDILNVDCDTRTYENPPIYKMSEFLSDIIPRFSDRMHGISNRASRLAEKHSKIFPSYSALQKGKVDLYSDIMDNLDEDDEIKYN